MIRMKRTGKEEVAGMKMDKGGSTNTPLGPILKNNYFPSTGSDSGSDLINLLMNPLSCTPHWSSRE